MLLPMRMCITVDFCVHATQKNKNKHTKINTYSINVHVAMLYNTNVHVAMLYITRNHQLEMTVRPSHC